MPLYRYICDSCKYEFEKLVKADCRDDQECVECGKVAVRDISTGFSVSTQIDTQRQAVVTAKEIDKVVGSDAEEKWQVHHDRTENRRKGMKEVDLGVKGKFNPLALMGDSNQKKLAEHYSEGLKAHREERAEKGQKQFKDQK